VPDRRKNNRHQAVSDLPSRLPATQPINIAIERENAEDDDFPVKKSA